MIEDIDMALKLKPRKKKQPTRHSREVPLDDARQLELEEAFAAMYVRLHNVKAAYKAVCPLASDSTAYYRGRDLMRKEHVQILIADNEDRIRELMPKETFYDLVREAILTDRSQLFRCDSWASFDAMPIEIRRLLNDAYTDQKGNIRFRAVPLETLFTIMQRLYMSESVAQSPLQTLPRELLEQIVRGEHLKRQEEKQS